MQSFVIELCFVPVRSQGSCGWFLGSPDDKAALAINIDVSDWSVEIIHKPSHYTEPWSSFWM